MISLRVRIGMAVVALLVALPASGPVGGPLALAGDDGSSTPMIWPTAGRISQPYGCTGVRFEPRRGSCQHFHNGIDIANRRGTPIRAPMAGTVDLVGWDPWFPRRYASWIVILNHGDGLRTLYGHLRARELPDIRRGARVSQGQVIGYMDTTGLSTGPHLHWAVQLNGQWVNPRNYVSGKPEPRQPKQRRAVPAWVLCRSTVFGGGATARVLEGNEPTSCMA